MAAAAPDIGRILNSRCINSRIPQGVLQLLLADSPQNLIALSQSGNGNTAAFIMAMLAARVNTSRAYPQMLCLSPTKESAQQTHGVLQQVVQHLRCSEIQVKLAVFGERSVLSDRSVTEHILIGTAGTILDWANKYHVFDPKMINMFVLDEGDVMIDTQGQQDQTIRLHKLLRPNCQHILFTATYSQELISFAIRIIANPKTICLIKQYCVWYRTGIEKYSSLLKIYGVLTIGQCIVFCRTTASADQLARRMKRDNVGTIALLTDRSLNNVQKRNEVLIRFREEKIRILITTATDIDTDQVSAVVFNYEIPVDVNNDPDYDTYCHRISRSGRFGRPGLAINFVNSRQAFDKLMSIKNHFASDITVLDTDDHDMIEELQN